MENEYVIGVDVGGSHILSGAVRLRDGDLQENTLTASKIDNKASKGEILDDWANCINQSIDKLRDGTIVGVGFGMLGAFNYKTGVALFEGNDKYESLYGVSVKDALAGRINASVELRFINDAGAFAVGEAWCGLSASSHRSILLTLGTGFGSSFVQAGIPVVDGQEVSEFGCLWHLPFKEGIADDYFSTRWFIETYKTRTGTQVNGAKEIHDHAIAGNKEASATFHEFGSNLAQFMDVWLRKFNPEMIVVAGNIAKAWGLIAEPFLDHINQIGSRTKVSVSELKESAAILGSARLFDEASWQKIKPVLTEF